MTKSPWWKYWTQVSSREWHTTAGRWRVVRDPGLGMPTYTVYQHAPCSRCPWHIYGIVFSLSEAVATTIRAQLLEVALENYDGRTVTTSSSPKRSRRWRRFR